MKIVKRTFKPIDKAKMYSNMILLSWFTIVSCWILKLFGDKEFEIPISTPDTFNIYIKISINCSLFILNGICNSLILFKRKLKWIELLTIIVLNLIDYIITYNISNNLICILIDFSLFLIVGLLFLKDKPYKIILEVCTISVIFLSFQIISLSYKNIFKTPMNRIDDFYTRKLLQIDYYILLILTILHEFKKGGYIYERWWKRFLVVLSNFRRNEKRLSKTKEVVQKSIENEKGFKLFTLILSIFQFTLVGTLCYFINNSILQYVVIFISFVIMRLCFGKSYHCNTVIKCTTLSCLMFTAMTKLNVPSYVSVLFSVILGTLLAYLMYVIYYFIKYTTSQGVTISKGIPLDVFYSVINGYALSPLEINILRDYYVSNMSLTKIAFKYHYSVESIKKFKSKALKSLD